MARPLTESTALMLVGLGRAVERDVESALSALGLSLRLVGALGHLAHGSELSYSDLARRARVTPQSMRATVERLEELQAVRIHTAGQGVAARLEVTGQGHALLDQARQAVAEVDEATGLELLPSESVDALRSTLMRIMVGRL